jgi:hypothetical protein
MRQQRLVLARVENLPAAVPPQVAAPEGGVPGTWRPVYDPARKNAAFTRQKRAWSGASGLPVAVVVTPVAAA